MLVSVVVQVVKPLRFYTGVQLESAFAVSVIFTPAGNVIVKYPLIGTSVDISISKRYVVMFPVIIGSSGTT